MATFYCDSPVGDSVPLLAGRFKLTRCIGGGSQGVAYVGRDLQGERDVVVKMLSDDERTLEDCIAEARIVTSLDSPHIMKVYGVGCTAVTLSPWMVFEYIEGPAVPTYCRDFPAGRLPESTAVHIAIGVLTALDECHSKGFVHGSPHQNNVMLRSGVEPVLIGFGRAVPIGASGDASVAGDVAWVGQTLYTMLTGHTPGLADQAADLRVLNGVARDVLLGRMIDANLTRIALRAMQVDPALRYRTAVEMRAELQEHFSSKS